MANGLQWMPLYVADYLADTGHLSTIEHGAYLLLMMHYWQNCKLPQDDQKLARICRLTANEWQTLKPTMAELFDSQWQHKRIDRELQTAHSLIVKRREAGKRGAAVRYGNRIAIASQSDRQVQLQVQLPSSDDNFQKIGKERFEALSDSLVPVIKEARKKR